MDASCKIQGSIHVLLCLIHKSMCPGFWVHIILIYRLFYSLFHFSCKFYKFFDFKGDVKLDVLEKFLISLGLKPINQESQNTESTEEVQS